MKPTSVWRPQKSVITKNTQFKSLSKPYSEVTKHNNSTYRSYWEERGEIMSKNSIWVITFSGKRNDWRKWSMKFFAVAEKMEYWATLKSDPDGLHLKIDAKKKMNILYNNNVILAMTEDMSFGLVTKLVWTSHCEGGARTAWGKLLQCI